MKIICIGRNYREHAAELNNPVPSEPIIFMKPSTALLINDKPFYYPEFSKDIHFEVEVVLKIAKNGKHIQPAFASGYYQEIGLGIDFTARDIQTQCKEKGQPWEIAKAFDHSAVVSPFIPLPSREEPIVFSLTKNGEVMQQGNTADMIFGFDHLIQYVSRRFTLHIGDYLFTGTPAGVGPIQIGDTLEGFIGDQKMFTCEIK